MSQPFETLGHLIGSTRSTAPAIATALAVAACGPHISEFSATPNRICASDSVSITMTVKGESRLVVVTRGGVPQDTTTYTLIVTRHGKQAFARQDVVRFWPQAKQELVFLTQPLGTDSVQAHQTMPAERWDSTLRIDLVASASGRAVMVRHAGQDGLLPGDGTAVSELSDLPVSGEWDLHAPLLPGEVLGDPGHPPPDRLRLTVTLACGTATPP